MSRQTNTARRAHDNAARQRLAAERREAQRREHRRRLWLVVSATVAVLGVIGAIVAVGALSSSGSGKVSADRPPTSAAVVAAVSGVPTSTLDAIGLGTATSPPKRINDPLLSSGGKPQVLYVGAEFCPYCAAERWTLVQALSRFGSFTGLKSVRSSPTDVHPNTPTFSFSGASYSSPVLAFTGRELETVAGKPLDRATGAETALWQRYTGVPGSFPFVDIAGRFVVTGPSYDPAVLHGLSEQQIASALADPASPVAKAIDGSANLLTAAICAATNGQPASVCSAAGVTAAAAMLHG